LAHSQIYLERTIDLVSETSFADRLNDVTVPVLIVSSAGDPSHSTESDLGRSFPQARVQVVDAGTEIRMEQPVAFATPLHGR
jgi:pimeloyl-ACP methyl ester carboxylesterase